MSKPLPLKGISCAAKNKIAEIMQEYCELKNISIHELIILLGAGDMYIKKTGEKIENIIITTPYERKYDISEYVYKIDDYEFMYVPHEKCNALFRDKIFDFQDEHFLLV